MNEKVMLSGVDPHLIVGVFKRHRLKLGKAFAEPGGDWALHVDGEWLKAFLEAADGKESQGAHVLAQVQVTHLARSQAADRQEAWRTGMDGQG
jgi:hypothetical protein